MEFKVLHRYSIVNKLSSEKSLIATTTFKRNITTINEHMNIIENITSSNNNNKKRKSEETINFSEAEDSKQHYQTG